LIKLDHPYAPKESLDLELRLPDLDTFEFGQLPELESLDEFSLSLDTPPPEEEDDDEDIWRTALHSGPANKDVKFYSWERFEDTKHVDHQTSYITESGPETLDAALAKDEEKVAAGRILREDVLIESLWSLGLGRSSILFTWDAKARTFVSAINDGRASGLSLVSATSLVNYFTMTGSTFLYLRYFVERTFASTSSVPARVALATAISSVLSTFEDHLGKHSNAVKSLLQLQQLFNKPRQILIHVARIVDTTKSAKNNEQLCSILHHRVLELDEDNEDLRRLSTEILCRVSNPSLELLGEWIGIKKAQDAVPITDRADFIALEEDSEDQVMPTFIFKPEAMPQFIDDEDAKAIFETGNSLWFLKRHHPEHPLTSLNKFGIKPPELDWKFAWEDIEAISTKARAYEEDLRAAILKYAANVSSESDTPVYPTVDCPTHSTEPASELAAAEEDLGDYFEKSIKLFNEAPGCGLNTLPDGLQMLTVELLSGSRKEVPLSRFSPPISLTSSLSFRPLLASQAKLVNATTLRLFFRSHQLRMHLSLQRQYHLLGDGVFSSRLASALFDPERESAERHKGMMRSGVHMGLQLGSRSAWPPASSELRLALMGVLSESFYSSALYYSTLGKHGASTDKRKDQGELPGQLNFSIRQLSETEMEKIMDPDSQYALDFLRLQYVPPSPLNLIISSAALEKYDIIFKFLLRLLRMLFVVSHLPRLFPDRDSQYFRMEAHHFVTAISTYIFQTGISEHWATFESYVTALETRMAEEDAAGELGTRITSGLESLKSTHEQCLDSIMFSLLLRRRQRKVMALLEDIFDLILLFSKKQRQELEVRESTKDIYSNLRGKIKVFISVCRGLTGKKGYGKGRGTTEENTLERLVVLLEMNGYYAG
jgi:hypothetical protein